MELSCVEWRRSEVVGVHLVCSGLGGKRRIGLGVCSRLFSGRGTAPQRPVARQPGPGRRLESVAPAKRIFLAAGPVFFSAAGVTLLMVEDLHQAAFKEGVWEKLAAWPGFARRGVLDEPVRSVAAGLRSGGVYNHYYILRTRGRRPILAHGPRSPATEQQEK